MTTDGRFINRTPEQDEKLRRETRDTPGDRAFLARGREFHTWALIPGSNQWDRLTVRCNWWNVFASKAAAWLIFQLLRPFLPMLADPDPEQRRFENHSFVILCVYHFTQ